MNRGIVILANNIADLDYIKLAAISATYAKKNLNVPVSLITDAQSLDTKKSSEKKYLESLFDKIILEDPLYSDNSRLLYIHGEKKQVEFLNNNRFRVFELSPYDRTLLIDSDFLIFSKKLNQFWDIDQSILIAPHMITLNGDKGGMLDAMISTQSIPLYWATTVMFTKNKEAESFFNLVDHVRLNYDYYSHMYQFSVRQYRNDISFSIAYHIMSGFVTETDYFLPPITTLSHFDEIYDIAEDGVKIFSADDEMLSKRKLVYLKNIDLHFMNKINLMNNQEKFL